MIRRVVGDSMLPTLKPGQLVLGFKVRTPSVGSLVIVRYKNKEIIKRLADIDQNRLYIIGDNQQYSSDSRSFGWVGQKDLLATVIWPAS